MKEVELNKYKRLNELADEGGIVIFGCGEDRNIPCGELRQAFAIEPKVYNRSFDHISIMDAAEIYGEVIAQLAPEAVLLHIGDNDRTLFAENRDKFDNKYRELIAVIKKQSASRIAVVSLKNHDGDQVISQMNDHLKFIAASEQCEYADIADRQVWNPKAAMAVTSFMYAIGYVRPLKKKRSLYELIKILFLL